MDPVMSEKAEQNNTSKEEKTDKESIFLTGRKALIATLIVVALNPVSICVGYYLSKHLSKPDIDIAYITPKIRYKKVALESDLLGMIQSNRSAFEQIKKEILSTECKDMFDEESGMDIGKFMGLVLKSGIVSDLEEGKLAYDFIEKAIQTRNRILSEYKVKIDLLTENMSIVNSQTVFDSVVLKEIPDFEMEPVEKAGKNGPQVAHKVLERRLLLFSKEKKVLKVIFDEFEKIIKQIKKERNGKIYFCIGFLNNGDTDGVIYPKGELIINGRTMNIIHTRNDYEVIEPHSFKKSYFEINKEETPQVSLDYLEGLLMKNIPEKYKVILKTSGGLTSIDGRLPVN